MASISDHTDRTLLRTFLTAEMIDERTSAPFAAAVKRPVTARVVLTGSAVVRSRTGRAWRPEEHLACNQVTKSQAQDRVNRAQARGDEQAQAKGEKRDFRYSIFAAGCEAATASQPQKSTTSYAHGVQDSSLHCSAIWARHGTSTRVENCKLKRYNTIWSDRLDDDLHSR